MRVLLYQWSSPYKHPRYNQVWITLPEDVLSDITRDMHPSPAVTRHYRAPCCAWGGPRVVSGVCTVMPNCLCNPVLHKREYNKAMTSSVRCSNYLIPVDPAPWPSTHL